MNQEQPPPPQQHLSPGQSAPLPPPPYFYHASYPHLLAPDPRHVAPAARAATITTIGSRSRSLSQPPPTASPDQSGEDARGDSNVDIDGEGDDEEPIYFIPLHTTATTPSHEATERPAAGPGSVLYHHQQQQQEPTHHHHYGLHPHQLSLQYNSHPFYSYPPPPPPPPQSPYCLVNHHHHHHHNQRPYAPMAHPHSSHYPSTLTGLSHHHPPPAVMMMHPAPSDTVHRPMYSVRGGESLLQQEQLPPHPQPRLQSSTLYSQRQEPASSSLRQQEQLEPEKDEERAEERDAQVDDGGASPHASSDRQGGLHRNSSNNKDTSANRTGPEDADSIASQSGRGARSGGEGGEDTGSSHYQGGDPLLTATLHEPIIELPQYIPIAITGGNAGAGGGEYVIFTTDPFYLDQNTGASHLFQHQRVYRHQPPFSSSSNSPPQPPVQYQQIQVHHHPHHQQIRLPGVASLSASASASQAPSANASVAGGGGSTAGDRSISPLPLAAPTQPSSSLQALQLQQLQLRWEQGERQRQQLLLQQQYLAREAEQAAEEEENEEQKESDENDDDDVVSANAVASTHDLEMDQAGDEESLSNEPQEENDEDDSENNEDDQYQLPVDATHHEKVRISSSILQQQLPEGFHPSNVYTHQLPEPHLITPQYDPPCSVDGTLMLSTSVPRQLPSSSKVTGTRLAAVANREVTDKEAGGGAVFKSDKVMKNGSEAAKSGKAIAATAKMQDSLKKKRSQVLPATLNGNGAASLKKKKMASIIPTDRDVLCGKGGRTLMHNRHFTSLCNKFCDEYSNTTKRGMNGKRGIALQIIGEIHEQKGRFLAPASEVEGAGAGDAWVEISTEKAINKVAHCIRDLVRRLRASSPA